MGTSSPLEFERSTHLSQNMRVFCILISTLALTAHAKQLNIYERMADETLEEFNDEFNIIDHLPEEAKAEEGARLKEMEDEINKNNNDPDSTFKEALNPWSDLPRRSSSRTNLASSMGAQAHKQTMLS